MKRTPLYDRHVEAGGKMVEFAGFEMPVQYEGVLAEHKAVREDVGVFDVSHMGEIFIEGEDAAEAADRLVTNKVAAAEDGQAVYSGLLNEHGGFVDDVVVYKFSPQKVLICVNAANREKDWAHVASHFQGVSEPRNESDAWAQIAIQGPRAEALMNPLASIDLSALAKFRFAEAEIAGARCIIARTGYTGEDGFEVFSTAADATRVWDAVIEAGAKPCGLGARDTLRLEYKLALYGNDIDDHHTPYEAGLGWIVKLDKGDFVGRDALVRQKEIGPTRKLVGFKLTEKKGVPRAHMKVLDTSRREIGEVTSGTMSPTLKEPIGLAYVPVDLSKVGTEILVDVRGRLVPAVVVKTPFVQR